MIRFLRSLFRSAKSSPVADARRCVPVYAYCHPAMKGPVVSEVQGVARYEASEILRTIDADLLPDEFFLGKYACVHALVDAMQDWPSVPSRVLVVEP